MARKEQSFGLKCQSGNPEGAEMKSVETHCIISTVQVNWRGIGAEVKWSER
jgi:hypothetical protein